MDKNIMKNNNIMKFEEKLIFLNGKLVLLDRDVALLYGVQTRVLNQNIKKNIELFPEKFRFQLTKEQLQNLTSSQMMSSSKHGGTRHLPYVLTEEGLYMVATILRSETAKKVHFIIVETFAKLKELNRNINAIVTTKDEAKQNTLAKRTSEILEDIIDVDIDDTHENGEIVETETKFELNLGFFRTSKTTKRKKEWKFEIIPNYTIENTAKRIKKYKIYKFFLQVF